MKYIKKEMGSFNLHLIKTDKFKTITVKVLFRRPIEKDAITIRNILSDMFMQSSKIYNSKRALTIKAQDLYALDMSTNNSRLGNYITTSFHVNCLNDKYTEKDNFKEAIKFLGEVIFNPDVNDERFNKEKLDIVKNNCRIALNSLKEDPASYSLLRMAEEYDKDLAFSYRLCGYLDDLDKIDEENLYEYYKSMIKSDLVDVFVLGDIDIDEVSLMFREYFKLDTIKKVKVPYLLEEKKFSSKREFNEKNDSSQSKLAIGCITSDLDDYERNYVLTLYNIILGGGSDSKFFKEIREENSLCYTIYSVPNKLDRLLVIQAGIDKDNYEKTLKLIEKDMSDMCKGKFSDEDISIAREYFLTALEEVLESPDRIIDNYLMMELIGTDTIEKKREMIMKVTKDEIVKLAKKVKLDTVFLLEGIADERD